MKQIRKYGFEILLGILGVAFFTGTLYIILVMPEDLMVRGTIMFGLFFDAIAIYYVLRRLWRTKWRYRVMPALQKVFEKLAKVFNKPVMANVSGFSVEEYAYTCEKINECEQVGWIEVNVSCPNVHNGGMSFGTEPAAVEKVVKAVKAVTTKPIIIKLSPNVTDIVSIAKAAESAGADGISLINTLLGMRIDIKRRQPVIANKMGGFSGSAIFPVAVRMVYQVYDAVNIPIVGMGGVSSAEDVIEMMLAGASAVQVGAANLVDPFVCRDIINNLPKVMEKYGITDLKEIIGGAH